MKLTELLNFTKYIIDVKYLRKYEYDKYNSNGIESILLKFSNDEYWKLTFNYTGLSIRITFKDEFYNYVITHNNRLFNIQKTTRNSYYFKDTFNEKHFPKFIEPFEKSWKRKQEIFDKFKITCDCREEDIIKHDNNKIVYRCKCDGGHICQYMTCIKRKLHRIKGLN